MTRSRVVGAAGSTPPLPTSVPSSSSSLPAVSPSFPPSEEEEEDEEADEEKDPFDSDGSATEPEFDEEAFILQETARWSAEKAELKAQRMAKLRAEMERVKGEVAALRAETVATSTPAEASATTSVVVNQTPVHSALRPRQLAFQSASRNPPSAAALAHQAAIDDLPNMIPAVQVNGPCTVVGSGRVSAPMTTTVAPAAPPQAPVVSPPATFRVTPPKVQTFSGDDSVQNGRVENWVDEINRWLYLSNISPDQHLDYARAHIPSGGSAYEWVEQRKDEVAHSGKQMTWEWLQRQLIRHYAQPVGPAAMQVEWQMLQMGIKDESGKDTGKSTRTVNSYTNRFLHYMRCLTMHSALTVEVTVIDRYVQGIKSGYRALYDVMLTVQKVPSLRFTTLQEAIHAAEEAEADLAITKATSSSTPSWAGRNGFRSGHTRAPTEAVNNLQEEYGEEGEGETQSPTSEKTASRAKLYGFRYITLPNDGRYQLSEKEQKMLYDERRCYRCGRQHAVGPRAPPCTNPVMKCAPKPLKPLK